MLPSYIPPTPLSVFGREWGWGLCSGLVTLDSNNDDGDTHTLQLGGVDENLVVGLAEIISGRPPVFTLRTRCTAQAYSLSSDDIHSIFCEARLHRDVASAAESGMLMRLVAQATAVCVRRKMKYLAAQWERIVQRVTAAACKTISAHATALTARVGNEDTPGVRGTRSTRTLAAMGRLFEDGMWSPRQDECNEAKKLIQ